MTEANLQQILEKLLEKEVYVEELSGVTIHGYLTAFDEKFLTVSQAEIFGRRARVVVDTVLINLEYVGSICAGVEGLPLSDLEKGRGITVKDLVEKQAKVTVQTRKGEMVEGVMIGALNEGVCLYNATVRGRQTYRSKIHLIFFNNIAHINTEVISIVPTSGSGGKKGR